MTSGAARLGHAASGRAPLYLPLERPRAGDVLQAQTRSSGGQRADADPFHALRGRAAIVALVHDRTRSGSRGG